MTVSAEGAPGSVALALADGASAPPAAVAEGRLRYNTGANRLEFSENASPWTPFSALAGYWSQTGTVVHPTTLTDQVAVGASALAGSEQFRVVGDCSFQGDIDLESGAGRTIAVTQAAADTTGNDVSLRAGDAGAMAGATFRFGGIALLQGGAGGDASGINNGSKGGRGRVYGGDGGDATGTGDSGEGGNVEIVGGQSPSPSGTGNQGNGGDVFIVGGFGDVGGETVLRGGFGNTTDGDIRIGTEQTANLNIGYGGASALPINLRGQPNILDPTAGNYANLDFTDGDSAVLSSASHGRIRFNKTSGKFEVSENGGAWTQMVGGASPWTNTAGVVYPNNTTDDVVVGATAMSGSEKFRVVGDSSLQGDLIFETGSDRNIRMPQMVAQLFGNSLYIQAAQGADEWGPGNNSYPGNLYLTGGDGGSFTTLIPYSAGSVDITGGQGADTSSSGDQAGTGGAVGIAGGRGGNQSTDADGGAGGDVLITGGQGRTPSGTGNPGDGGNVVISGGPSGGTDGLVILGAGQTRWIECRKGLQGTDNGAGLLLGHAGTGVGTGSAARFANMTNTQRDYLTDQAGMVVWSTTDTELQYNDGSGWAAVGASPWTEVGGVVYPNNTTDNVVIGATAMSGSEKLRVVGDIHSRSGDINIEHDGSVNTTRFIQCLTPSSPALLYGTSLSILAGQSPDNNATAVFPGGAMRTYGGRGGDATASGIDGGFGGRNEVFGGFGGEAIGAGDTGGDGGDAKLAGGNGGNATGGATSGAGGDVEVYGGQGGLGTGGGRGGNVTIYGGSGSPVANGNGGTVQVRGGTPSSGGVAGNLQLRGGRYDAGTDGTIYIADDWTDSVQIGNVTDNPPTSFLGIGAVTFGGHQALAEQSGDPAATANQGKVYTKDVSGATQLFYRADDGTIYQLTPTGQASSTSVQSTNVYSCPVTVNVGDAVHLSAADTVDKADASVPADRPVIGFVKSKPTTTSCVLHYYGELSGFSGLTVGSTYYLSDTTPGAVTTTAPTTIGHIVQEVGFARNSTTLVVFIDPDFTQL